MFQLALKFYRKLKAKRKYLKNYYRYNYSQPAAYKRILHDVKEKKKIKVAFLLIHESVWKYEEVYKLFVRDERFDPVVVVCPCNTHGELLMHNDMERAYNSFQKKGYNVINSYNKAENSWLDIKKEIKPDLVFFTNPHKLTRDEYYIPNFLDCLTCYVPYAFVVIHLLEDHYNQPFHNLLWKGFYETPIHKKIARKLSVIKAKNVAVTGYPAVDGLIDKAHIPKNVWKLRDENLKKIIWAPHHTIDEDRSFLSYSNFLLYHEKFIELARLNRNRLQIAFKPHPLLKAKLFKEAGWGEQKTNEYYKTWNELENGQLDEGDYIDLFLTSDAMIHDSASFMVEYLYTNKPVMFTMRDEDVADRFNEFGKEVFEFLYHGRNWEDILDFIEHKVFKKEDNMLELRQKFLKEVLLPPMGRTASENIYHYLVKELT